MLLCYNITATGVSHSIIYCLNFVSSHTAWRMGCWVSLVPRPHPDFISQPWRKIGRRPGIKLRHDRKWWTQLRNDGNVPTHNYVASSICLDVFVNRYGLHRYQVTNKRCLDISGRRFAFTLTERLRESSRLRASASKQVSALGPLSSRRPRARAKTA